MHMHMLTIIIDLEKQNVVNSVAHLVEMSFDLLNDLPL